ncbi:MAG TPA: DUF6660 family protein [Flavobacteriaceae bacterium]|nr:DUF6660 family protein [Flavobacteriaceae bacterium]
MAVILSFYFLGMNFVPCSDAATATASESQNFIQADPGSQHEHSTDSCPPFCSCQCCQSQLTLIDFPVFQALKQEFRTVPIFYKTNPGKEFPTAFFQPPRA